MPFFPYRVQDIIETDNQRYNDLKVCLRERMQALEEAMQECAQFTDKLDGMLHALEDTARKVNNAEPIAAHPEKIKEQMDDNNDIIDDLEKKEAAYEAVKKAANDIVAKAPNKNDPAIKVIFTTFLLKTTNSLTSESEIGKKLLLVLIFCANFHFWHFSNVQKMIFGSYRNVKKGVFSNFFSLFL